MDSANNLNRMRLGPGKHLHGQELFGGAVKGEDFDYFQYAISVRRQGQKLTIKRDVDQPRTRQDGR